MNYDKIEKFELSPAPKPFPGKHPTRILIQSKNPSFKYEGKPVPSLLQLVREQYILKQGRMDHLVVSEYDQNGAIRITRGGSVYTEATFANIYFPMPTFYREFFGRAGHVYMMLDREQVEVQGRKLYRNKWWENSTHAARFRQMLKDCSKDRVNLDWFDYASSEQCSRDITPFLDAWTHVPTAASQVILTGNVPRPPSTATQRVLAEIRQAQVARRGVVATPQVGVAAPEARQTWAATQAQMMQFFTTDPMRGVI